MKKLFFTITFLLFYGILSQAMQSKKIGIWTLIKLEQLKTLNTLLEKNEPFVDAVIRTHLNNFPINESTFFMQTILTMCRVNNLLKLHTKLMDNSILSTFKPLYSFIENPKKIVSAEDPSAYLTTSWIWNSLEFLERDIQLMTTHDTWPLIFSEKVAPIGTLSWIPEYNELALAIGPKLTFFFNCAQLIETILALDTTKTLDNELCLDLLKKSCNQKTIGRYIHNSNIPLLLDEYKKPHIECKNKQYHLPLLDEATNHVLQNIPLVWSGTFPELMYKAQFFMQLIKQSEKESKNIQEIVIKYSASLVENRKRFLEFQQTCIKHMETFKDFSIDDCFTEKLPDYYT